ncbi:cathepsin L, partial [Caerostris extrusa]
MMKWVIILSLFALAVSDPPPRSRVVDVIWENYKTVYEKSYSGTQEEQRRRAVWEGRISTIIQHNLLADTGKRSFRLGLNKYSDLTYEEYLRFLNGYKVTNVTRECRVPWVPVDNAEELPDRVDWRVQGMVTPVKDQKLCGSCWAFSTTGSLEGQHKKKTGNLVSLSEQNLIDCVKENNGCNGGWMDPAFELIKKENGIDTEISYPYSGIQDSCFFNEFTVGATCTGYVDLPEGDEAALKMAVATKGPISVAIDSSPESFYSYNDCKNKELLFQSGVYDEPLCGNDVDSLTHGVLVVGYGTERDMDYWLVKN